MFSYFGFLSKPSHNVSSSQPSELMKNDETNENLDHPPIFPAINSIQRSRPTDRINPLTSDNPILKIQSPDEDDDENDTQDEDLPDINLDNLSLPHSTLMKPPKPRKKVHLLPGFSQLDWAKLKSSGANLRGEEVTSLRRITRSEVASHKTKEDAWSSFNGKVYNITPYLNYHPGGVRELMRVAGKDGTELFMKTHAWISIDSMMDACLLGFLAND